MKKPFLTMLAAVGLPLCGLSGLATEPEISQAGMIALVWLFLLWLYRKGIFLRI